MDASDNSRDKITPKLASISSIDILIWAIIAIQIIVAVYGFKVLPYIVPIHWGANGQVNGFGPKWVGTFLHPLISIGVYALVRVLMVAGPRLGGHQTTVANLQIAKIIIVGVLLFMLIIQLATLALSLGIGFDITMVITLALSVLFIFLGNYMGKIRRNFWMNGGFPCRYDARRDYRACGRNQLLARRRDPGPPHARRTDRSRGRRAQGSCRWQVRPSPPHSRSSSARTLVRHSSPRSLPWKTP